MAVVSACESGNGVIHEEEGTLSMARGFLFSGIPTVVTNLWEVEDHAAQEIIDQFYADLALGKPVDESLHNAQVKYLHSALNTHASPFFWASFISLGKSGKIDQLKVASSGFSLNIILGVVIFSTLAMLIFLIIRFKRKRNSLSF